MKDWKQIAVGNQLDIPADQLERIGPALKALEAAFRPLVAQIPHHVEPALIFQAVPEGVPDATSPPSSVRSGPKLMDPAAAEGGRPRPESHARGGRRMTLLEAATALRARKISSVELTTAALAAIGRLNPKLKAFLTLTAESAQERARQADAELASGQDRGPLHGIPVAIKDVFCTRGVRTTCGSRLFADYVPDHDAAVVEELAAAGAVLVGKTGLHELAYGVTSNNPHFGAIRNPWNPDCIPGGSSGGSAAAVGADLVFMALGTDTGGSIRIPAAYCGTVGLKPTFGRVSRYGVLPLDFSLDHTGPLTRSVRDAAVVLDALAGHDPRDPTCARQPVPNHLPPPTASIRGLRVGVPENFYFDRLEPEVEKAVRNMVTVAQQLGAEVVPVRVPDIAELNVVGRVILLAEAAALLEKPLADRSQFGADVLALLDQGRLIAATDYVNAQRLRRLMRQDFNRVWDKVDCLFTPTTPMGAPRIGATTALIAGESEDVRLASTRLVRGVNVLGLPALALPCGLDRNGLPLSLQIIGPAFDEVTLLRVGAVLEDATDFHQLAPSQTRS